jgi:hypothetical protein
MCASLYLTPGPAQASLTANGLHINGLSNNGLSNNGWINGLALPLTSGEREASPAVPNDRLPFNGLSQQGLGSTLKASLRSPARHCRAKDVTATLGQAPPDGVG